jgi:hypothetical protein
MRTPEGRAAGKATTEVVTERARLPGRRVNVGPPTRGPNELVVALIRLESRNEGRGAKVNLAALAGRIESLQLLYQALSADGSIDEIDLGHYLSQIAAAVVNTYAMDGIRLDLKSRSRSCFAQYRSAGRACRERASHQFL